MTVGNSSDLALTPEGDGVDHINVYTRGHTALGRSLSNLADIPVDHPTLGRFRTLEGLWFWAATGMTNNMLRVVNGYDARKIGSNMPKVWDDKFQTLIKVGIAAKILGNTELFETLRTAYTHLPLHHYYCYGKGDKVKVVVPKGHRWQMETIEQIRSVIIERCLKQLPGKEVDFSDLLTEEYYT